MKKKLVIFGLLFIVGGIGLAFIGFLPKNTDVQKDVDNWNRLSGGTGTQVEGRAVSVQSQTQTEGVRGSRKIATVYCAVYEYAYTGGVATAKAVGDDCKDSKDQVVLGSNATILYDPNAPTTAFVKSDATAAFYKDRADSNIVAVVIGALLVVLGAVMVMAARPKTPEQIARQQESKRKADEEMAKLLNELDKK